MEIDKITPNEINEMDYNQLIGLTKETNRIPGGRNTVFEIINRCCLDRESNVLEIGTSTGFTAIELSRLIKCNVTAIDINEVSLNEARKRAEQERLNNISFIKADVDTLPFDNSKFDLIILGNILSIVSNKERAFQECRRVCKKTGFIAVVPMFYTEKPCEELIKNVSKAIKVDITPLYKKDWYSFFDISELEIYWMESFKFDYIQDHVVKEFVDEILKREHLKRLDKNSLEVLKKKYIDYMFLFRDNLSKMGFFIILISNKRMWEDPELYTSRKENNKFF